MTNKKYQPEGLGRTREIARIRDKHRCQDCGKRWIEGTRRLDVHHLNGLCGKRSRKYDRVSDLSILITLCHKCHFNRPEHKSKSPKILTARVISRNARIVSMRKIGLSYDDISMRCNLSREGVRQIFLKYQHVNKSVAPVDGGGMIKG